MNKTSESIIQEVMKKRSFLNSQQQDCVLEFLRLDSNSSYQQIAKALSTKINASELDIYYYLMTRDKDLRRNNDYNKPK
jgi:hypothetical protein